MSQGQSLSGLIDYMLDYNQTCKIAKSEEFSSFVLPLIHQCSYIRALRIAPISMVRLIPFEDHASLIANMNVENNNNHDDKSIKIDLDWMEV